MGKHSAVKITIVVLVELGHPYLEAKNTEPY